MELFFLAERDISKITRGTDAFGFSDAIGVAVHMLQQGYSRSKSGHPKARKFLIRYK